MGDELKEEDFTEERIEQVRADVKMMIAREAIPLAVVARESNGGESTLHAFLSNKYDGRNSVQAMKLQRWLTARLARTAAAARMPKSPGFVRTPTAEQLAQVIEHAHLTPDMAVIVGDPGIGKTTVADAYCRTSLNAWLMTCEPCSKSPRVVLDLICVTLGLSAWTGGSGQRVSQAIVRKLKGLGAVLIVDEAQHLSSEALDQLRTIHDLAQCGVVLMGNRSIFTRLEGGSRTGHFAQLFSRVGMRVTRKGALKTDIDAILDAWEIADAEVRKIARAVARKPGALRVMNKVLRQAHLRAQHDGVPVEARHMTASANSLGDERPLEMDA